MSVHVELHGCLHRENCQHLTGYAIQSGNSGRQITQSTDNNN